MTEKIRVGDMYVNESLHTEILVVKELGNARWLVRGKMGEFTIREHLIRSSYKKKELS
jgi:hypothetical protein